MKGLPVETYRSHLSSSCKWKLSDKYDSFILCGPGVPELCEATDDTPALVLVHRLAGTKFERIVAFPLDVRGEGTGQYAFGGNFVYSCDGRFPSAQPIHIHDYTIT